MEGDGKREIIAELVALLAQNGDLEEQQEALGAVLHREDTRTTAIGNGLAIPHAKTSAATETVMAIGVARAPVDFDSVDGLGVTVVVLLVSPPEKSAAHIQVLARISRILGADALLEKIAACRSAEDVFETIRRYERTVASVRDREHPTRDAEELSKSL